MNTKARKVMDLLNNAPDMTNKQVAEKAKCHPNYVWMLRKKMAHVDPCPEQVLELTPAMEVKPGEFIGVPKANTIQEGGDHYKRMGVQPWDIYDTWPAEQRVGAYRANCVKYTLRLESKDSRALNARKLKHYAAKLVEVIEELEAEEK